MRELNIFLFEIYPYVAVAVFLLGSWLRYDHGAYTWRAASSQMLNPRGMWLASNAFHLGMLGIIGGHAFGMLTPHWVYESFLPIPVKQKMAMLGGGACGVLILLGVGFLLWRRLTDARVRSASKRSDLLVIALLVAQAALGLATLPLSAQHMDGSEMMKLVGWAQAVATFHPAGASLYLEGVAWVFKLHLVLGLTLFVVFPFTRLVHVWSVPLEYVARRYQLVRVRR